MCVCVCGHTCNVYVYIYMYAHMHIHTYLHSYIFQDWAWRWVCSRQEKESVCVFWCVCVCACNVYLYISGPVYICIPTYIHTYSGLGFVMSLVKTVLLAVNLKKRCVCVCVYARVSCVLCVCENLYVNFVLLGKFHTQISHTLLTNFTQKFHTHTTDKFHTQILHTFSCSILHGEAVYAWGSARATANKENGSDSDSERKPYRNCHIFWESLDWCLFSDLKIWGLTRQIKVRGFSQSWEWWRSWAKRYSRLLDEDILLQDIVEDTVDAAELDWWHSIPLIKWIDEDLVLKNELILSEFVDSSYFVYACSCTYKHILIYI